MCVDDVRQLHSSIDSFLERWQDPDLVLERSVLHAACSMILLWWVCRIDDYSFFRLVVRYDYIVSVALK